MTAMKGKEHPIIIVRRKKVHAAHHGGAWKVAYADFVTAMMAFFLVMWLSAADSRIRDAVAGYFRDPGLLPNETSNSLLPAGMGGVDSGRMPRLDQRDSGLLEAEAKALVTAADQIREKLLEASQAASLRDQIEVSLTREGLRIELVDQAGSSFFDSGSAVLRGESVQILQVIAAEIAKLRNDVVIEGHTDSRPYAGGERYGNWELSVDRANSARRVMREAGVGPAQVRAVRGFADTELRITGDAFDPRNRRVSIVVRTQAAASLEDAVRDGLVGR
jgi:chemotaxis protein MotB